MKLLLVQPPLVPAREVIPPVGLCTLASWLTSRGHRVRILDLDLEVNIAPPASRYRYDDLFIHEVQAFRPDVIGVTSMYSNSLQAECIVRAAKRLDSALVTVAGGPHFGALGALSLSRIPELDYVVEGEGELAFATLLEALAQGKPVSDIPRLGYRRAGQVGMNESGPLLDLADLPPMWSGLKDVIDLRRYVATIPQGANRRVVYVEAGRGCPFACSFCATAPFWQRKYRVKPVSALVEEIEFLHESFGYDSVILVHDLLTVDRQFISDFCDALLLKRLPIEWMANSRTDLPMRGLLPKMKAAGCWKLFFGVESASERVQRSIGKRLKSEDVFKTITELRENGMTATASFVIGLPDESVQELSRTIAMGANLKLFGVETVQFHRLRLFPPSPLSQQGLPAEFDLEALKIEYPFVPVPEEDVVSIREARDFFEGYFSPLSKAGTAEQLAQAEMFFHHLTAMAPLTLCSLAQISGELLVPTFYEAVAACGGLRREELDWEGGNLWNNWRSLAPLLSIWLSHHISAREWQARLLEGVREYEAYRLAFVSDAEDLIPHMLTSGAFWQAFPLSVDLVSLLERLREGLPLTEDLLRQGGVVLAKKPGKQFAIYVIDEAVIPDLMRHSAPLVATFAA